MIPYADGRQVGYATSGCWSPILKKYIALAHLRSRWAHPGTKLDHFIKDMEIALVEAERMGLSLPGLELAKKLYKEVRSKGHGRSGTQALYLALKALNESSPP